MADFPSHEVHVPGQEVPAPVTEADYARRHTARCAAIVAAAEVAGAYARAVNVQAMAQEFERWILRP